MNQGRTICDTLKYRKLSSIIMEEIRYVTLLRPALAL